MKKNVIVSIFLNFFLVTSFAQGYQVGSAASDFKLKNIDGKMVSLSDFKEAKGFVVIFTCNHCPYAKAYENRIIELDHKYRTKGFPVVAISSNDANLNEEDSYENMVKRSQEKNYTFPYLYDETQEVCKIYGAKKTPHTYLLQKTTSGLIVSYIGAIDDNFQDETMVKHPYLATAIESLLTGKKPDPNTTKAVGCSIKHR